MMKYSCMICLVLMMAACGKRSGAVIGQEEMKLVLWDMMRADEVAMLESVKDTTPNNLLQHAVTRYEQVFAIHHIDKEQFYNSYKYYQEHPDKHKELMDSLTAYGNKVKEQLEKKRQAKVDSLQKAAHIRDSIAAKKDTLSKDSAAGKSDTLQKTTLKKDTLAKSVIRPAAPASRVMPPGIKVDTGKKYMMKGVPMRRASFNRDSLLRRRLPPPKQ